jgi:hypothetical protein
MRDRAYNARSHLQEGGAVNTEPIQYPVETDRLAHGEWCFTTNTTIHAGELPTPANITWPQCA